VEDSGVTLDQLRSEGFSEAVIAGIDAVTKREGESYEDFVVRAKADPLGRRVKIADLEDNSDLRRLPQVTDRDRQRLEKYQRAMALLTT
jgi:hypothetical protein